MAQVDTEIVQIHFPSGSIRITIRSNDQNNRITRASADNTSDRECVITFMHSSFTEPMINVVPPHTQGSVNMAGLGLFWSPPTDTGPDDIEPTGDPGEGWSLNVLGGPL